MASVDEFGRAIRSVTPPSKQALRRRRGRARRKQEKATKALRKHTEEVASAVALLPTALGRLATARSALPPQDERRRSKLVRACVNALVSLNAPGEAPNLARISGGLVVRVRKATATLRHDDKTAARKRQRDAAAARRDVKSKKRRTVRSKEPRPPGGRRLTKQQSRRALARTAQFDAQVRAQRSYDQRLRAGKWMGPRFHRATSRQSDRGRGARSRGRGTRGRGRGGPSPSASLGRCGPMGRPASWGAVNAVVQRSAAPAVVPRSPVLVNAPPRDIYGRRRSANRATVLEERRGGGGRGGGGLAL